MKQYGREAKCVIGELSLESLAFEFDVKLTASVSANTLGLKIYNLSDPSRKVLEAKGTKLPILLEAGYTGNVGRLFLGKVRDAFSVVEKETYVTEITAGDGESEIRTAPVAVSIPAGATAEQIMEEAVKALGLGEGNLASALTKLTSKGLPSLFPKGGILHGNAMTVIERVCRAYGFSPSIQGESILLLDDGPVRQTAEEIGPDTGLIGSPKVDSKKHVAFDCLMRHNFRIGDSVLLNSRFIKGPYRLLEVSHKGATHGNDWTTSCVGDRVESA